jgi:hypothetical protein
VGRARGGEAEAAREREARRWREGCSGREPAGAAGNWG